METEQRMKDAAKHSRSNRSEIEASGLCACYCCESTVPAKDVCEWTPSKGSLEECAVCPTCGCDSLIGDASGIELDPAFLSAMSEHFFGT